MFSVFIYKLDFLCNKKTFWHQAPLKKTSKLGNLEQINNN